MPGPRNYKGRDVKKLYALIRNMCSKPDCRRTLVVAGETPGKYGQLGKIAHIRGAEPNSARYDDSMTDDERRSFENLILLCAECHDRVDDLELQDEYSVELLTKWKNEHEDNSWEPAGHIDSWGKIVVQEGGEQVELPYFKTERGLSFFTEEQWSKVEGAFWIYVEIAEMVETLRQVREMNRTHIKAGLHGINNITQAVERLFTTNPKALDLLPKTEDPSIYESPGSRVFSLMQGGSLTLDQLLWLATNPQTLIVATSIEAAAEIE